MLPSSVLIEFSGSNEIGSIGATTRAAEDIVLPDSQDSCQSSKGKFSGLSVLFRPSDDVVQIDGRRVIRKDSARKTL